MQSAVRATAIPSVRLSVRPSVTRGYCTQTNEVKIMRYSLWGSKNTLVFWHQQWLRATSPSTYNLRSKWHTPSEKRRLPPIFAYNVSTVRASEKSSVIANRKLASAFQRAIDEVRTWPRSPPKGGSKNKFVIFVNKNQLNQINSATKFLCVKISSNKVVAEPVPHLTVYIFWRYT